MHHLYKFLNRRKCRYILLWLLMLHSLTAISQRRSDTLSAADKIALVTAYRNSSFGAYYYTDSFSHMGDSIRAGKALMDISPYYMWYNTETTPADIDSFLAVRFLLPAAVREKYVQQFVKAFTEPKSSAYETFKAYHDEDQEIRKMDGKQRTFRNLPLAKAMHYSDSIHFVYLYSYVLKNGWPGLADGALYANVLAVHDHARHAFYRPYIIKAILNGDAPLSLLELTTLWRHFDRGREDFLKALRTKEHIKIETTRIISDEGHVSTASTQYREMLYSVIADLTKKMCPLNYYFTNETHVNPDGYYDEFPNISEVTELQNVIINNNCYQGDTVRELRDKRSVYHGGLWTEYTLFTTGPRKRYVYLVSDKPRVFPSWPPGSRDTFSLFFEKDKHVLLMPQQVRLQTIMLDSIAPSDSVAIIGYADVTGEAQANKRLSLMRAETIRDYLLGNGLKKELFTRCRGAGPVPRDTITEYPEDRRVDIIVVRSSAPALQRKKPAAR